MDLSRVRRDILAHIGQAAKTGLAAAAAFYLARFVGLPEGYWAAITAIIVCYSDLSRTVKASAMRLIGTAIGASVGGAFAAVFGQRLWAFVVAVMLTLLVCGLLGFAGAARLAGVAVAIVMLGSRGEHPWIAALHRFLEVSFGIVIAVLFSAIPWPKAATRDS